MNMTGEGRCPAIPLEFVRSLMFVPSDRRDFLSGVMRFAPDGIVFDLQDSVAPDRKDAGRKELARVRDTVLGPLWDSPVRPYLCVRINPVDGGQAQLEVDIDAVIRSGVDGMVVPEVRSVEDLLTVDRQITKAMGVSSGATPGDADRPEMLVLFETSEAIDLVDDIVSLDMSTRLGALLYGREDLTDHVGVPVRYAVGWSEPGTLYPRARLIWAAKRRGLPVLDSTPVMLHDDAVIRYESELGRNLGFTGRACIHPAQIPIIDRAYAPSGEDVSRSRTSLQQYREAVAEGRALTVVDGVMVDRPIAALYEKALARAERYEQQDACKEEWKTRRARQRADLPRG